ncbi:MAG: hypothetical protein EHM28_02420 [Spirochaetaceae bacterium]|nr:MAG: hypothetical protein EHM28_02420 [Spirochaetaceae bacterium]
MKKILVLVLVCVLSLQAFAQDKGTLEIETGVDTVFVTGMYDGDGEFDEIPSDISYTAVSIPISVFYEIITGLQLGVKAQFLYFSEDWLDASGIGQPAVGVKYTSDFGLGAFLDVYLPFGSEDIVGTEPEIFFDIAVFYDGKFDSFLLYGELIYEFTLEGDDELKQDSILLTLQPGYQIMDSLAVTLTAALQMQFDVIFDGESVDDTNGYLFSLAPGAVYQPMDMLELSLEVPITLFGKSQSVANYAYWGINFNAKFNLL